MISFTKCNTDLLNNLQAKTKEGYKKSEDGFSNLVLTFNSHKKYSTKISTKIVKKILKFIVVIQNQ